jgi:acyl carrier protein
MSTTQPEINESVRQAVASALGLEEDEVTPDATLMDDLGAESIDLLDILFRIERSTGVKIKASDLGEHIQGGIPDDEFGQEGGTVSDKGLEQLKTVMPQIDADSLRGSLAPENVIQLFTVQNLADMVAQRAGSAGD